MRNFSCMQWYPVNFRVLLRVMIAQVISENSFKIVTESKSDQQLMRAYQKGDVQAFELLYKRHKDALYRFVLRQGLTQDLAEELYQEVWSAVIKARNTYSPKAKFTTWIYQIARNKVADHYRKHKSQLTLVDNSVTSEELEDQQTESQQVKFRERLLATLSRLPFAQRQTFLLYYEAALSIADIAEVTQASHEAVKSQLRYAVTKLKTRLGKNDGN